MTSYVALLRAVNVAGHAPVAMLDLRATVARLGFVGVQTLLNSGNVVCRSSARPRTTLERLLERGCAAQLSLETDIFVRTAHEMNAIVTANPFPEAAANDPGHLVVLFLKHEPSADDIEALQAAIRGRETVHVAGTEMFAVYPDGIGRSRLTNALIERKLRTRATARNWNTVLKLGAAAGAP